MYLCLCVLCFGAAQGLELCPQRQVLVSNFSTNDAVGPNNTVELRLTNDRKSRLTAHLQFVQHDKTEVLAAVIPPFQFASFSARMGSAWRVRDAAEATIIWQAHIGHKENQVISLQDCTPRHSKFDMAEPPMRLLWKSNLAQVGGAAVELNSQAELLCGGNNWNSCPPSEPVVFEVSPEMGQISWPHSDLLSFPRARVCPHCNGTGAAHAHLVHSCSICNSTGVIKQGGSMEFRQAITHSHSSSHDFSLENSCPQCGGFGSIVPEAHEERCPVCHGARTIKTQYEQHIEVPLAVAANAEERFAGRGNQGKLQSAGDIVVKFDPPVTAFVKLLTQQEYDQLIPMDQIDFKDILRQTHGSGTSFGAHKCLVNGTLMIGVKCTENIPAIGRFVDSLPRQADVMDLIQPEDSSATLSALASEIRPYGVYVIEGSALKQLKTDLVSTDIQTQDVDPDTNETQTVVVNSTVHDLLDSAGLLNLQDMISIQRKEDDPSVLKTMTKVSIIEAVNGFHAAIPLADGRVVHAVSTTPKSPFQIMTIPGAALPLHLFSHSSAFGFLEFCTRQPYTGNLTSTVPQPSLKSTTTRSLAKALGEFLRCVASPNSLTCAADPRKESHGLLQGLKPFQAYSFSSFAEFLRNPALLAMYAAGGCAQTHSELLGTNPLFTAQDALKELSGMKRCVQSCQESIPESERSSDQQLYRWKGGWCEKVCPSALSVYLATACVEDMPQRAHTNLGHLAQMTNVSHGVSFASGFIPFCALSQDVVEERSSSLQASMGAHMQRILAAASARYLSLTQVAAELRAKAQKVPRSIQDKGMKLTLTSDARFLRWTETAINSTRAAAHALQAAGVQTVALQALRLRSTASLFLQEEREALYADVQLQVAVMYPSSLDEEAQQRIKEAFGDPSSKKRTKRRANKKSRKRRSNS